MKRTENLGLRYPQCDPPYVKDPSDIAHLRDLAEDADAAVATYATAIDDLVVSPDAARMRNAAAFVSTTADNTVLMDTLVFDNTAGNAMADLSFGGLRIVTDGWYLLGSWTTSTVATDVQTRTAFLVNGTLTTNYSGPSGLSQAGRQDCSNHEVVRLLAGDLVQLATRNGSPGTSVSYTANLWGILVAANV